MTSQSLLHEWFPQATFPFLCNAPMYGTANAELATAVTKAGGFGDQKRASPLLSPKSLTPSP